MRRYARTLILITLLAVASVVILGIQTITIGEFERGGDTMLGLSLGLDLQGGSYLKFRAIDAETGEPVTPELDQMEGLLRSIERRVNASGLGDPIIQLVGDDRLLIQLPGVRDTGRAKELIGETAQLVFKHRRLGVARDLDQLTAEDIVSVELGTLPIGDEEAQAPESAAETSEGEAGAPLESSGVEADAPAEGETEEEAPPPPPPVLYVEFTDEGARKFAEIADRMRESLGLDENLQPTAPLDTIFPIRLSVSIEGNESRTFQLTFGRLLGPVGQLFGEDPRVLAGAPLIQRIDDSNRFAFNIDELAADLEEAQAIFGDEPTVLFNEEILGKVDEDISLTGEDLSRAYAGTHSGSGVPIVTVEFNQRGARIFGELTSRIAGSQTDQIAIFLDDDELISPQVRTAITAGSAIIQGRDFDVARVRDLALLLESGRLPVPIELIEERNVDAILGADSLRKSVIAGLVGLGLVLIFMTLYYRVPGLVASVALLIYASVLLAIFKILPITLNLAGVAAVILSIGMAVDANILIFERMKEELRAGRTLLSAINIGFNRAWPAIRDGNVSTLITCGILFWFSDQLGGSIIYQGFAATLAIGVLFSMFSAVVVSRTFLRVLATTGLSRRLGVFVPSGGADLPQRQQQAAAPATQRS